ncbi:MAG: glycosyltransferase, partial [Candidatus Tectomicrobia bacterium]|nr:glycosyltransferase [Candidatus Tectomicrobia bacterium]
MKTKTGTRVLMFLENCTYPKDGRVRREATAMLKAGYEVGVICPRASGQPRREVVDGVRVYRYRAPAPGHGLLSYVWEYGYSLTATFILSVPVVFGRGVDVIHLHNPPDLPILVAAV